MLDIDLLVESEGMFMTTLPEGPSFTWRLLTMKEYRVFSTLRAGGVLSEWELYDKVFTRCYVGEALAINGHLPAGIFLSIGELIMHLSGDAHASEGEEIDAARSMYNQAGVLEVVRRIVLLAFPYKPEELDHWTRQKLFKTFVEAEAVLQNRGDYQPLDTSKIMTAEQMAAQENKPVVDFRKDNRDLGDEFGDRKHALDLHPAELDRRAKKTAKLKQHQLRQVEQSLAHEERAKGKHRRR